MNYPKLLYARILRNHRLLPKEFRAIGDSYVKQEFRQHMNVTDKSFLDSFFKEWESYADSIEVQLGSKSSLTDSQETVVVGKDLNKDILKSVDDERAEQILELRNEISQIYKPQN
ncbi:hypothetical protein BB559_003872 [Furculomyces boomerangus]|uniref:Succinate dehydrogenase assembly factor 3 n=2 Tax=Harpellales TaxID=61421 RepID=A0A2T9YI88_9FUNG|nr:hypothetical protein BB559_003872 [Furculomyces boomerangus]PWA00186.1 hypothetical protein BB558_003781 [Smittium angustum]PWA01544.1 hypothetical protein BB558_002363 [Smittium angustum]